MRAVDGDRQDTQTFAEVEAQGGGVGEDVAADGLLGIGNEGHGRAGVRSHLERDRCWVRTKRR